jgi:hypothetical protein
MMSFVAQVVVAKIAQAPKGSSQAINERCACYVQTTAGRDDDVSCLSDWNDEFSFGQPVVWCVVHAQVCVFHRHDSPRNYVCVWDFKLNSALAAS